MRGSRRNAAVIGDDPEGIAVRRAKPDTMAEMKVSRTLVKSSPELWAECSDAASLARHLGAFGEIQITKLEPETAVAWEGEDVCGTVSLEPSGWGTRVVLTASGDGQGVRISAPAPAADPATEAPTPVVGLGDPAVELSRPGFFRRLFGGWRRAPDTAVEPEPAAEVHAAVEPDPDHHAAVGPAPVGPAPVDPAPVALEVPGAHDGAPDSHRVSALVSALDSLGMAHRRPFTHG